MVMPDNSNNQPGTKTNEIYADFVNGAKFGMIVAVLTLFINVFLTKT